MRCQRCQGCMISDHFIDILNVSGEIDFEGWRCLNCGEITDQLLCPSPVGSEPSCEIEARWWDVTLMHCIPVHER